MRFVVVDERDVSLTILESALKQTDAAYLIERDEESDSEGALTYNSIIYGQIEVNRSGDGIFDEEVEELKEFAKEAIGEKKAEVLSVLNEAKAIIAVRVLSQGREDEETLERIDPLWHWLFSNRKGLMHADGEGYYDVVGLVLKVA